MIFTRKPFDNTAYSGGPISGTTVGLAQPAQGNFSALGAQSLTGQTSTDADFTIVLLPDTQYMVETYTASWTAITNWIIANKTTSNIQAVISLGDVTNNSTAPEFTRGVAGFDALVAAGIPAYPAIGNHDYDAALGAVTSARTATRWQAAFTAARLTGKPWYGGCYGGTTENIWGTIAIGSSNYLIMCLEMCPRPAVIAWAQGILDTYPNHRVFLETHVYLNLDGTRAIHTDPFAADAYGLSASTDAQELWDTFIKVNPQIFFVAGGHFAPNPPSFAYRIDANNAGRMVPQIVLNHQEEPNGGNGYIGLMKFRPSLGVIELTGYSVTLGIFDATNARTFAWQSAFASRGFSSDGPVATSNDLRAAGKLVIGGDSELVGSLGLGVRVPLSKLDVAGGAVIGSTYAGATAAPSNGLLVQGAVGVNATTFAAQMEITDSNFARNMPLRLSGRFGIVGAANLHLTNNAKASAAGAWQYNQAGIASKWTQQSDGATWYETAISGAVDGAITWVRRFTLTPTGLVGIGTATSTPLSNLDIAATDGTISNLRMAGRFNFGGAANLHIMNNTRFLASAYTYETTAVASKLTMTATADLTFGTAISGTAGNTATFGDIFKIASTSLVGIGAGAMTPLAHLDVAMTDSSKGIIRIGARSTWSVGASMHLTNNTRYEGNAFIYETTAVASRFTLDSTANLIFATAISGTAGNTATYVDMFKITPAGAIISTVLSSSTSYASDAAASGGGVAVGQLYRNGSVVQVRVT